MDSGFRPEHFELLRRWRETARVTGNPEQDEAYAKLIDAYEATAKWARAVRDRVFPRGEVRKLSKPTNQAQKFKPYTWVRIYPWAGAPAGLAYTVGIDAGGEFCIKIDTVNLFGPQRERYEALRGPDHGTSPIAAILTEEVGLGMSFEQLVDWSVAQIARFQSSYDDVASELGLLAKELRLVTDAAVSSEAFERWRDILLEQSPASGRVYRMRDRPVWFVTRDGQGGPELSLGLDPTGQEWAVEINAPPTPGDFNRLSAIGVDEAGGRYLLRQGWLRGRRPAPDIRAEFKSRTGLTAVSVQGEGKAAEREWFVVANLDDVPARIRQRTAEFVELCWAARTPFTHDMPAASDGLQNGSSFEADGEKGGSYLLSARPAIDAKVVDQLHGTVWECLARVLAKHHVKYRKWRHARRYEIDMEVERQQGSHLLVEIKTGCCLSDVYSAVGQLEIYRKLFPQLANHQAVMLIDTPVTPFILQAVEALDIVVHQYEWPKGADRKNVQFSEAFLQLCGVPQLSDVTVVQAHVSLTG